MCGAGDGDLCPSKLPFSQRFATPSKVVLGVKVGHAAMISITC